MTSNHHSDNIAPFKRVLIVGANGQLGQEFRHLASSWPHQFTFLSRSAADLTSADELRRQLVQAQPEVVINCAAYTQVDRAEQEREPAYAVNVTGVKNLAESCLHLGATLIHFSSDYVYHNHLNRPLQESDPTTPQGYYAQTKLWGEEAARQILPTAMIIRTSWVYSVWGHNFLKTMLRLGQEKPKLTVVDDQIGTPTWARDLATAVLQIITDFPAQEWSGIYNFSNAGVASWYDFAHSIFRQTSCPTPVIPIPSALYPTAAPRPAYSVLNKQKIITAFGLSIPHWEDSLALCMQEL